MDFLGLQNKIAKGMGVAARKSGSLYDVYRPKGLSRPIGERNRIIRLFASITLSGGNTGSGLGKVIWSGVFDTLYTQTSDYLVGEAGTFFVASQAPQRQVQCVMTNRVITIARPTFAAQGQYSGLSASPSELVIDGWPACMVANSEKASSSRINGGSQVSWTALLPHLPVCIKTADVINDDLGSTYVVGAAEQNPLGWHLLLRQVGA